MHFVCGIFVFVLHFRIIIVFIFVFCFIIFIFFSHIFDLRPHYFLTARKLHLLPHAACQRVAR